MDQKFTRYESIIPANEELYLLEQCHGCEGFKIILHGATGSYYRVLFDSPLIYMFAHEGMRLLSLKDVVKQNKSYIYTVDNSELLKWFLTENLDEQFKNEKLIHWAVITPDEWFDVISRDSPIVEKL